VLSENLRRLAEGIVARRAEQKLADSLADEILAGSGRAPRTRPPVRLPTGEGLSTGFVVRLIERLRDQDPKETPASSSSTNGSRGKA
jgi:cyclic beta-1,2-glucan synthetase